MRIKVLESNPTQNGTLFAEVWEKSKAMRAFTKDSKRTCKCHQESLHQCRQTIKVNKPKHREVPPLGSTLLEPWVANQVDQKVRHLKYLSVMLKA
jgi:hypothetical protein